MIKHKLLSLSAMLMTALCIVSCGGSGADESKASTAAETSANAETAAATQESTTTATQPPVTVTETETTTETTVTTTAAVTTEETTTTTAAEAVSETTTTETAPDDSAVPEGITTVCGNGYSVDIDESIWVPEDNKNFDFAYKIIREDSRAAISLLIEEHEKINELNIGELGKIFENNFKEKKENSDVTVLDSNIEETEIDGHSAFKITLRRIKDDDETNVMKAVLIGIPIDNKLYLLNYAIAPEEINENEFGINEIIDSFKFK